MIFHQNISLPRYISLKSYKLGYLRLRAHPAVMRIHNSKRKEGHEQFYSELMLFCHWRDEEEEFKRSCPKLCELEYQKRYEELVINKKSIYPGETTIDLLDCDESEVEKPAHLMDMLDSQSIQENDDDNQVGSTNDPKYASFGITEHLGMDQQAEDFKYKKVCLPDQEELQFLTQRLVPEQLNILRKVINFCKDVVKARSDSHHPVEPLRLIVHGGAGNI